MTRRPPFPDTEYVPNPFGFIKLSTSSREDPMSATSGHQQDEPLRTYTPNYRSRSSSSMNSRPYRNLEHQHTELPSELPMNSNMAQSQHYNHFRTSGMSSYSLAAVSSPYTASMHSVPDTQPASAAGSSGYLDWGMGLMGHDQALDPNLMSFYTSANHRSGMQALTSSPGLEGGTQPHAGGHAQVHRAMSSESHESDASGERKRGGGGRRQRGRPRLDTKDESPADRRRTQIRLAQRAYRQRKETTISSLRGRVTELEGAVDTLNELFHQLQTTAVQCINNKPFNLDQQHLLNDEIKRIGEQASSVARQTLGLSGGADTEGESLADGDEEDIHSQDQHPPSSNPTKRRRQSRDSDGDGTSGYQKRDSSSTVLPWPPYTVTYGSGSSTRDSQDTQTNYTGARSRDSYSLSDFQLYPDQSSKSYLLDYTLQSHTFSHRLHKLALDQVYGLLSAPVNDAAAQRALSRTVKLGNQNREQHIETIKGLLAQYYRNDAQAQTAHIYTFNPDHSVDTGDSRHKYLGPEEVQEYLMKLGAVTRPEPQVQQSYVVGSPTSTLSDFDEATCIADSRSPTYEIVDNVDSGIDDADMFCPSRLKEPRPHVKYLQGIRKDLDEGVLMKELLCRCVCFEEFPGWTQEHIKSSLHLARKA